MKGQLASAQSQIEWINRTLNVKWRELKSYNSRFNEAFAFPLTSQILHDKCFRWTLFHHRWCWDGFPLPHIWCFDVLLCMPIHNLRNAKRQTDKREEMINHKLILDSFTSFHPPSLLVSSPNICTSFSMSLWFVLRIMLQSVASNHK